MKRVVVDTNVIVRATKRSSGPARELLGYFERKQAVLLLSPYLLTELARVLTYPRVQAMHGLAPVEIEELLQFIGTVGERFADTPSDSRTPTTDPDDDPIVRLAIDARADVLCTRDRHLRHRDVTLYLEKNGVSVLTDVELLTLLRRETASSLHPES